jgi:hypothetical protein
VSHAGPFHRCASPSCRFARWVLLPAAALGFALTASLAFAQTPPVQVGPTVAVTFHAGFNYSCAGVELEQWGMVYGERCNAEPPVVLVPFIATVLVRLTPLTNPPTPLAVDPTRPVVIRTVARGSVYRTADAVGCVPTPAPCLSVRVASLTGFQAIDVALVDASGAQSEWTPLGIAEGRVSLSPASTGRVRP